jgi:hypothetical protein
MTAATGQVRLTWRRRVVGAWLLFVFLFAQAVPVVALTVTDGMAGMECCKRGKSTCCRRKPMEQQPSFRAPHPCGMPCCGTPSVGLQGNAAIVAPALPYFGEVEPVAALRVTEPEARASAGVDPSLYQRPPPHFS